MIRIILPAHLQALANLPREVRVDAPVAPLTQRTLLDALEAAYPALGGTVRDHATKKRRPLVRFFAGEEDLSHESADAPLPEGVAKGEEPFVILGAIAGG